ncbi:hypothetical protein Tco_1065806 [Tanacetum coccineum]
MPSDYSASHRPSNYSCGQRPSDFSRWGSSDDDYGTMEASFSSTSNCGTNNMENGCRINADSSYWIGILWRFWLSFHCRTMLTHIERQAPLPVSTTMTENASANRKRDTEDDELELAGKEIRCK